MDERGGNVQLKSAPFNPVKIFQNIGSHEGLWVDCNNMSLFAYVKRYHTMIN